MKLIKNICLIFSILLLTSCFDDLFNKGDKSPPGKSVNVPPRLQCKKNTCGGVNTASLSGTSCDLSNTVGEILHGSCKKKPFEALTETDVTCGCLDVCPIEAINSDYQKRQESYFSEENDDGFEIESSIFDSEEFDSNPGDNISATERWSIALKTFNEKARVFARFSDKEVNNEDIKADDLGKKLKSIMSGQSIESLPFKSFKDMQSKLNEEANSDLKSQFMGVLKDSITDLDSDSSALIDRSITTKENWMKQISDKLKKGEVVSMNGYSDDFKNTKSFSIAPTQENIKKFETTEGLADAVSDLATTICVKKDAEKNCSESIKLSDGKMTYLEGDKETNISQFAGISNTEFDYKAAYQKNCRETTRCAELEEKFKDFFNPADALDSFEQRYKKGSGFGKTGTKSSFKLGSKFIDAAGVADTPEAKKHFNGAKNVGPVFVGLVYTGEDDLSSDALKETDQVDLTKVNSKEDYFKLLRDKIRSGNSRPLYLNMKHDKDKAVKYNALALKQFCGYNTVQVQNYIIDSLGSNSNNTMKQTMDEIDGLPSDSFAIPKKVASKICPTNIRGTFVEDNTGNENLPYPNISSTYARAWNPEWSKKIADSIDEHGQNLLNVMISEKDLEAIDCPGFNDATNDERKVFWSLMFASMAKSESDYRHDPFDGKRGKPIGLLQLEVGAKRHGPGCAAKNHKEQTEAQKTAWITDEFNNLQCGVQIMNNQLTGWGGKWPGIESRLFPTDPRSGVEACESGRMRGGNCKKHFYWAVLSHGKHLKKTQNWFKANKEANPQSFGFCEKS